LRTSNRSRHLPLPCRDRSARVAGRPTLRLLVDETVAELILRPHIAAFLVAHPSLCVELHQRAWASAEGCGDIDLALQYAPSARAPKGAVKLDEQRLLTCAAPQYLRGRGLPHHPSDLRRQRHDGVAVSNDLAAPCAWKFAHASQRLSIDIGPRATAASIPMALVLALNGVGISQIPECWGIGHVRSGRLVRLFPDWETSLHLLASLPRGEDNAGASALLRFVRTLIESGAPSRHTGSANQMPAAPPLSPLLVPRADGVSFAG
jgi:DNA-binding transcriptional LysR family regulator